MLFGRRPALERIEEAVAHATRGGRRLLLLTGEVGFFMKGSVERRMGSLGAAHKEDLLKREAFYHSAVQAQYLRLCFPILEQLLCEIAA